ncbi:MAG: 50S ribosomal protein L17 [Flavobacteriaceae bacterium]
MRHGKKINHLSRTASHRSAMLANMACSLIEHKRIQTTTAKAKALKRFVEPIITKAKAENNDNVERNTHNRRIVFSYLRNKEAVSQLFAEVAEKVADRPGGYTRIIKLGNRSGDNADMALIELVDFNETYDTGAKKKSSRKRKKAADAPAQPAAAKKEAPVEEAAPAADVAEEVAAPEAEEAPEAEVAVVETAAPEESTEEPSEEADDDTKKDAAE